MFCVDNVCNVCNICAVPVDKSQERYDENSYQVGKCPYGAFEQLKDKVKCDRCTLHVVMQSIRRKGKIFGSFL